LKTIAKSRKAEAYFDAAVTIFVLLLFLIFCLNIFSFLSLKQNMDHFSKELMLVATTEGRVPLPSSARQQALVNETGINPTASWRADYFNTSQPKPSAIRAGQGRIGG
jgi:hypothetical protein